MLRIIQLDRDTDVREAGAAAVAELEAGRLALLPDECGWNLVGLATQPAAVSMLNRLAGLLGESATAAVCVSHPQVVFDYTSDTSRLFRKLSARCWPGPVILRTAAPSENGLAQQWAGEAVQWGRIEAGVAFTCPADHFTGEVLSRLSAPALGLLGSGEFPRQESLQQAVALHVRAALRYTEPPTCVRVSRESYSIERAGVVSERMLQRLAGDIYLFVCTGNTCRSPMAEVLFRKMLAERLKCRDDELMDRGFMVVSAGLAASRGAAASYEAVELLRQDGIDLSGHESQPVTEELLFHCDEVLTMTRSHRDALIAAYPELAGQVRLLSPRMQDISDPIGAGREEYARCRDEIVASLEHLLDEIDFPSTEGTPS